MKAIFLGAIGGGEPVADFFFVLDVGISDGDRLLSIGTLLELHRERKAMTVPENYLYSGQVSRRVKVLVMKFPSSFSLTICSV